MVPNQPVTTARGGDEDDDNTIYNNTNILMKLQKPYKKKRNGRGYLYKWYVRDGQLFSYVMLVYIVYLVVQVPNFNSRTHTPFTRFFFLFSRCSRVLQQFIQCFFNYIDPRLDDNL